MRFDVFFSFSKMDTGRGMPSDERLYRDLFGFLRAADALGYERAWIGEAHYSLAPEQDKLQPLLPHFRGELCINTDLLQIAAAALPQTRRIGFGSAIRNILVNGGPVAHAEMIRTFLTIHGEALRREGRKLHIGFGAGRFAYANAANGIRPRDAVERLLWPQLRGAVLREATEIFLRLLSGETLGSRDIPAKRIPAGAVEPSIWAAACRAAGVPPETPALTFDPFWSFAPLRVLPTDTDLSALELTLGSHDPHLQVYANRFLPVRVFNLSVTPGSVIDETHARMRDAFHPAGGPWTRDQMPRTVMVFVRADAGLDEATRDALATEEAAAAMHAYWQAMEGTVDEAKVRKGMENAVYGSPRTVARMLRERFHPEDRLMVWFDFNTHDPRVVERRMREFQSHVVPLLPASPHPESADAVPPERR